MAKTLPILTVLAALVLVACACGPGPTPANGPATVATPVPGSSQPYPVATRAAATPTGQAAPYPVVGDGKTLMNDRCTKCHNTDRIQSARKSPSDWNSTVARMKGKGAVLSDAETKALVDFLAANYR